MLLSICIPSYNRGHRAFPLVQKLLTMECGPEHEIEIILSNNGSDKNTLGYEKLKELQNKRFYYHEFDKNMRYWGNLNQVIKMSHGDFCLCLSDEDEVVPDALEHYFNIMEKYPEVGIIRSRTDRSYTKTREYLVQGVEEAIVAFFMGGNYLSGVIYNRKIVTNEIIDYLADSYKDNNSAYYYYPHMFIDTYACLNSDYYESEVLLVMEGNSECDQEKENSVFSIPTYATYESRLEQMHGFFNMIENLEVSEELKTDMFLITLQKYVMLMGLSFRKIKESAIEFIANEISASVIKSVRDSKYGYIEYAKALMEQVLKNIT